MILLSKKSTKKKTSTPVLSMLSLRDSMGDRYIPPLEVEFQFHELWNKEREIINLIYIPQITSAGYMVDKNDNDGMTSSSSPMMVLGYKVFFLRILPVTPSRFRPPQHLHGETFEHPQNVYLSRVRAPPLSSPL